MANKKLSLDVVNRLSEEEFEKIFSNVIECWPQASINVWSKIPFTSFDLLLNEFTKYLNDLDKLSKEQILQFHPDLAGKLASEGKLTKESTAEQESAGLNKLNDKQLSTLQTLNQAYKDKNSFPFVICVRETNKIDAILRGLEERLNHSRDIELNISIDEVKKICRLRCLELIDY